MTFAIITPALIVGAFAERMKFSAMLWFMVGWLTLVYLPVCHMVWGGPGAFFYDLGVLDFAGGIVVHVTAGVSALVLALALGRRLGWPQTPMAPHNLTLTVTGTGMLWVGWFGFNAGSALGANARRRWRWSRPRSRRRPPRSPGCSIEWRQHGRPSVLGICTGSVAGLAAVTPASGFVGPLGALMIGVASGRACYWASMSFKRRAGYDDSLDVFGVHGVGGFLGTVLAGVFASSLFGGNRPELSIPHQLGVQLFAATACGALGRRVSLRAGEAARRLDRRARRRAGRGRGARPLAARRTRLQLVAMRREPLEVRSDLLIPEAELTSRRAAPAAPAVRR